MKNATRLILTFVSSAATWSFAAIPEPDVILHGTVLIRGDQVLASDDVRVVAKVTVPRGIPPVPTEQIVGIYRMGDSLPAGDNYVLRIRIENLTADGSTTQSTNAAIVGQTASLFVRQGQGGIDRPAGSFLLSAPGIIDLRNLSVDSCGILSANPAQCAIDARQTGNPDGSSPAGLNSVELAFDCAVAGLTPSSFTVSVSPPGPPVPTIANVISNGVAATLQLTPGSFIPAGAWTCFLHSASSTRACFGNLPGDVTGNGTTDPSDALAMVDVLNGNLVLQPYQTDANRSGQTNPLDLARTMDILNGAGALTSWNARSIGPCPQGTP
ncbi:MAG: hypothetical protein AABZ47_05115 [Planctomycetota bacterium]